MKSSVFVYGTLMSPQVVEILIGRTPTRVPAILEGYIRHPVRNHVFPGLLVASSATTRGILYRDLTPQEMKRFDWFEDIEYARKDVTVQVEETGENIDTQAYLWANPEDELETDRLWEYDTFEKNSLEWYLENTVRPCRLEMDREGI